MRCEKLSMNKTTIGSPINCSFHDIALQATCMFIYPHIAINYSNDCVFDEISSLYMSFIYKYTNWPSATSQTIHRQYCQSTILIGWQLIWKLLLQPERWIEWHNILDESNNHLSLLWPIFYHEITCVIITFVWNVYVRVPFLGVLQIAFGVVGFFLCVPSFASIAFILLHSII